MTKVWHKPSLSALEIFWRWVVGAPIVALAVWRGLIASRTINVHLATLQAMTVFRPVAAFHTIDIAMAAILPAAKSIAVWLLPLAAIAWMIAAALGRTAVLRRFDRTLHARPLTLLALGVLRAALLTIVWLLWLGMIVEAGRITITGPAAHGGEPNIVLYSAVLICGTLFFYVLWAACSWPFQLAPLIAMQENLGPAVALRRAFRSTKAGGKLAEVNLSMNIVKLAVLVLAMVLSASPLAFSEIATKPHLEFWWSVTTLFFCIALDYFHVVHAVAQLNLWRVFNFSGLDPSRS